MNNLSFCGHLQFIHFPQSWLRGDVEFKQLIVNFFTWQQPGTNLRQCLQTSRPLWWTLRDLVLQERELVIERHFKERSRACDADDGLVGGLRTRSG
jgi:hypothetical protein